MSFLLIGVVLILAIGTIVIFVDATLQTILDGWVELKGYMAHTTLWQKIALAVLFPIGALLFVFAMVIACYGFSLIIAPDRLWLGLPVCLILWFRWKASNSAVRKTLAKGLEPWLMGMAIAILFWLVAVLWVPRASWPWLFWIEERGAGLKTFLDHLIPKSLALKIVIAIMLTMLSAARPHLQRWVGRYQLYQDHLARGVAILTVLSGVTLFGHAQATNIIRQTEEEKQSRTEAQTTAAAQLMLADRFHRDEAQERAIAQQWVDAVASGAVADVKAGEPFGSEEAIREALHPRPLEKRLRDAIEARVADLREALAEQPVVRATGNHIDMQASRLLGRPLGARDRVRAKLLFERALKDLVGAGAGFTAKPLEAMLTMSGARKLAEDLVVDLEKDRVRELAAAVTDPLADALFRPRPPRPADLEARVDEALEASIPRLETLPVAVRAPTVEDRLEAKVHAQLIKEVIERIERVH